MIWFGLARVCHRKASTNYLLAAIGSDNDCFSHCQAQISQQNVNEHDHHGCSVTECQEGKSQQHAHALFAKWKTKVLQGTSHTCRGFTCHETKQKKAALVWLLVRGFPFLPHAKSTDVAENVCALGRGYRNGYEGSFLFLPDAHVIPFSRERD